MIFLIVLEFAEKYTDATKLKKYLKNLRNNLIKDTQLFQCGLVIGFGPTQIILN